MYSSNNKDFKHYGGRGIEVCDKWRHSFATFHKDMGEKPKGMSLDQIDPDGNYKPSNCRWATRKEQTGNRRNTLKLTHLGRTDTLKNFSEEYNMLYFTLYY